MKTATRTLALTLACFFVAATGFAQSADDSFKEYKKLRDNKEAKPSPAYSQQVCDAGTAFLAQYGSDTKRARQAVNELLSYGTGNLGKDKVLAADWYAKLTFAIVDKEHASTTDDKGKAALAALAAAVAEGEAILNPTGQAINSWRAQIDKLAAMPNGQPYVLDREKGFYNLVSKVRSAAAQKVIDAQLSELSKSKDRDTANWAKQETKIGELRKPPLTLAFTALDGKQYDSTKLKGTPVLYVYFWNTTSKNAAAEMEKVIDMYYEFGRKQIEIVAYCCDPEDKRAEVQAFVKKAKIKFPVYFDGTGNKGEIYGRLAVGTVPAGYLFNSSGLLINNNVKPGDLKNYIK